MASKPLVALIVGALVRSQRALVLSLLCLGLACGSSPATSTALPSPTAAPIAEGRNAETILATTALRPGSQRVAFLLAGEDGLIEAPNAIVTPIYLGAAEQESRGETKQATFHRWPYGTRGSYSTELTFDQPGSWRLDIEAVDGLRSVAESQLVVEVAEEVSVPEIGSAAPPSQTKTLGADGNIAAITSDYSPDPELYQLTLAEAIESGKPSVVVFATPAFCVSPTCGPQVDVVSELKEAHREQANFIHVEIYDNPQEIQRDLSQARLTAAVDEWGLSRIPNWRNESWTFILDAAGVITQRFEGFAPLEELEEALQAALADTS